MSIPIDSKLGINPALTICPRCGGESNELVLAGRSNKYKCPSCGQLTIAYSGQRYRMKCANCGEKNNDMWERVGPFDGTHEKVVASGPCEKCRDEIKAHRKLVESGGVYWKCKKCGSEGVVKPDVDLAKDLRKKLNKPAPEVFGVEFDSCPVCEDEKEA